MIRLTCILPILPLNQPTPTEKHEFISIDVCIAVAPLTTITVRMRNYREMPRNPHGDVPNMGGGKSALH